tara:strand:- start:168 stop:743 length:576 start_codon:yes stop_codon:yes gene_type:complete
MELLDHQSMVQEAIDTSMSLSLPNWCIVGGLIRDLAWGRILGRSVMPRDIDLIYFDAADISPEKDWQIEGHLRKLSGLPFRVNNQARMHQFNSEASYTSVIDAMSKFPTTVSAIGISGSNDRAPLVFSIFGYGALFKPVFQITPHFKRSSRQDDFNRYLRRNGLFDRWPEVPVETSLVCKTCTGGFAQEVY